MKKEKVKILVLLHIMLMVYSMSGICSKMASKQDFISPAFCFYYGIIFVLLGLYAIGWQQVIKRIPLTVAFANKAITVVWGLVWGVIFFGEEVTTGKLFGIVLIVSGIIMYAKSDKR